MSGGWPESLAGGCPDARRVGATGRATGRCGRTDRGPDWPERYPASISFSLRYRFRSLMPRMRAAFWRCPLQSSSTCRM